MRRKDVDFIFSFFDRVDRGFFPIGFYLPDYRTLSLQRLALPLLFVSSAAYRIGVTGWQQR
jgi:hypothetical protein